MPRSCNQTDLENIAKGACFLASGGGGTYESGRTLSNNFVQSDYYAKAAFEVIDVDEVEADAHAVVVAYIGAPEAIKSASYPRGAVNAVERIQARLKAHGKTLKYVVPVEVGSLSSVVPCLVASRLGLQVIDGDGAGRAVPELTMLTYSSEGISCNPTLLANSESFYVDLGIGDSNAGGEPINDAAVVEKIARPMLALPQFKQIAGLAVWVMDCEQIKQAVKSRGTLRLAQQTGELIAARGVDEVLAHLTQQGKSVQKLFHGRFNAKGCSSLTAGGFDHGTISIVQGGDEFRIVYQNESLLGWSNRSDRPLVMAPDSIALFVENEQKVYSIGDVMDENGRLSSQLDGTPVVVVGIAAEEFLRSEGEHGLLPVFMNALRQLGYYGAYEAFGKQGG